MSLPSATGRKATWGAPDRHGRPANVVLGHDTLEAYRRDPRYLGAVDCGQYVNPDTVVAQMESGIVYGLSAALCGKITIDKGRAVQDDFDSYQVLRIDQMPLVETHIVAEGDPMGGIGELGTPPIAPTVCNALLVLTGKPVRRLPIVKEI